MTITLGDLFDQHLTDKGSHGYDRLYEQLIPNPDTVTDLLEIGIGTCNPDAVSTTVGYFPDQYKPGASLRAWADYLPGAHIWGLDNQPDCMFDDDPRITTTLCDSADTTQVAAAIPSGQLFDLIVDDGNHTQQSQLATLTNLYKHVKPGGWYVIEDVYIVNIYQLCEVIGLHNWHNTILRPSQSWKFAAIAIPCMSPEPAPSV